MRLGRRGVPASRAPWLRGALRACHRAGPARAPPPARARGGLYPAELSRAHELARASGWSACGSDGSSRPGR
eukprot:7708045-Pyramimonas_sp.AAC.1